MLLLFLFTSFISFAGSLQLGTVNLSVIQTVLYKNIRSACWVALGGSLPEMFYGAVALWFSGYISTQTLFYLEILVIPVLVVLGVYNIRKKNKEVKIREKRDNGFWQGLGLGILNPQLLPFWFAILVYLKSLQLFNFNHLAVQLAFVAGTAAGALALLLSLAFLIYCNKTWADSLIRINFNRIVGIIFVGLAALQVFYLLGR